MSGTPNQRLVLRAPPAARRHGGMAWTLALPLLGSLGSVAMVATMGGSGGRGYLAAGLFVLSTLGFVALQLDRQRDAGSGSDRRGYLRHLAGARETIREAAAQQREALDREHPDPAALATLAGRLRPRGPEDPLFLQVRYAVGRRPLALELVRPEETDHADPPSASALARLLGVHATQPDLPLTLDLPALPRLAVTGPDAGAAIRALLCSAAASHAPADLAIAVLAAPDRLPSWEWLTWLPHTVTIGSDPGALPPLRTGPHLLLVTDGVPPPTLARATVLTLDGDGPRLLLDPAGDRLTEPGGASILVRADRLEPASAEAFARRLAPANGHHEELTEPDWRPRSPADRLRVAFGTGDDGAPVELDLKEAAEGGMGPHGLLVGATGSGKSELLRTLTLRLALTHPPDRLSMVLVDFKGGATFAGLAGLPHVSGLITNLAGDLGLVDRMHDALAGELARRQELLHAAGAGSLREYSSMPGRPPLPALLVVVDEFAELLAARPDLLELFVAIGRLGRSLGLHLLLSSQRLEEGRLRGLEAHLSYRIGLRTFSAQESRAVLGVPDAHLLPAAPGVGYLSWGPGTLRRFRAAYVSGPVRRPPAVDGVRPFTLAEWSASRVEEDARTVVEEAVARLAGPPAHRIWLPPLEAPDLLGDLLAGERPDPGLVPVGTVDLPRQQHRETLVLDLRGAGGHIAIVGGPRSGKSTLLQTVAVSLALSTPPRQTQLYLLDLGGALAPVAGLPHVAGRAGRDDAEVVHRIVTEAERLVAGRERGESDDHGTVHLLVDDWGALREAFEDLEPRLERLAQRGLAHRVHLVVTAVRWTQLRPAVRDLFGTPLELRLGDPLDSEIDRSAAARVPRDRPGRGLTGRGEHFLAALPLLADTTSVKETVALIAAGCSGPPAPRLRLLPRLVPLTEVRERYHDERRLLLGVREPDLAPLALDPSAQPHLLALGDPGSGKTSLLRAYAAEVVRTHGHEQAQLVLVDQRRTLLGEVPESHLLAHLPTAARAAPALADLAERLARRLPGPDVTPDQLRARSWWRGPEVFVLVDDYELVAPGAPLQPLLPLLAQAGDVGLHLVLARRCGGAARALYDPAIQALRDLRAPGLLLSGSPEEGPLLGSLRPAPLPPGRARLVGPDAEVTTVQLAWTESRAG